MLYLLGAIVWFAIAGLVFAWQWLHPEFRLLEIGETRISFGWFALLLACYNLVRWWSRRSVKARQPVNDPLQHQRRRGDGETHRPEQPPNPDFDFSKEPRKPDGA